jgi:hypothetical protein
MVSGGLSVAVSLQDIFPMVLGGQALSSQSNCKAGSTYRVNANAQETVPASAHQLGNFRKVSGVPDNDARSLDDGSCGVLDVSRLVVLAF